MPVDWRGGLSRVQLPFKNNGRAIAIGIGVTVLAPIVIPAIAKAGKPLVKSAIKGGLVIYNKGKGAVAEATEIWGDLVAEAQAELNPTVEEFNTTQNDKSTE